MIIDLERTGGFGGVKLSKNVNTAKLPQAEATKIEQLASKLIGNTERNQSGSKKACDQFQYKLRIDDKVVSVADPNADAAQLMHYLLDF